LFHNLYKYKKISGEWFNLDFDDVKKFKQICEQADKNFKLLKNDITWT
jgi:hypothetical protein